MAGKEHNGVAYADALLFENATYVLCPPSGYDTETFAETFSDFVELIQQTGARVLVLDPQRHDRIAATVSHVPQLVAVALMNLAARSDEEDGAFLRMGAGGFRDMTRIASSPFGMWGDILDANHEAVATALDQLIEILRSQQRELQKPSSARLANDFEAARAVRRTIPKDMKGFLRPLVDVYVYAIDRPGFLAHLTRTLYDAGLNIKDMELLKIREGTGGTFRVSFADGTDADRGVETLNANGYTAYRL
jgi:prephenate dehydrogenase